MGFKEKMLKAQETLNTQYEESIKSTDDSGGFSYGSIFIKDKIPEGVGMYKLDVREHYIDIVPFFAGKQHPKAKKGTLAYHVDLYVHRDIGVENDHFVCQKGTWKSPDPICTHIARTRPDKTTFKQIAQKRRCVYLVYDRNNPDLGLQILEVSHFFFQKHLDGQMKNPKGGPPVNFAHPTKGKSIWFEVKKTGSYETASGEKAEARSVEGLKFVDRDDPIPDEIFDAVSEIHLDELIEMHPDPKKQEAALDLKPSQPAERDETEEEEEEPEIEEEEEPEEEESTSDILDGMNRKELKAFIKENDLEIKVYKSMSDDDIREKILEAVEEPEEEEEEPEIEEEEEDDSSEESDGDCPHGYNFGEDLEKYPECNNCDVWDDCNDALAESSEEEEEEPEPPKKKKTAKKTGKKKMPVLRKKK